MAILHGETAKWPKQQAERKFFVFVMLIATISVGSGFLLGIAVVQKNTLLGFLILIAGVVSIPLLIRALNRPMRELGKQRIRHWRGAQTEAFVAWIIQNDLDNSWHLFNSVKLQQDWDIDHILVGPGGVFVLSTKSQRGLFSLAPDRTLLLNNQPTDLAKQAASQAAQFHDRLKFLMDDDTPWVQSILAAPFAYTDFNETSQTTWILHQENLIDTLEAEGKKNRLNKTQLARALQSIQTLADNAEKLYRTKARENTPMIPMHNGVMDKHAADK